MMPKEEQYVRNTGVVKRRAMYKSTVWPWLYCPPTVQYIETKVENYRHSPKRPYSTVARTVRQFYSGKYPFLQYST